MARQRTWGGFPQLLHVWKRDGLAHIRESKIRILTKKLNTESVEKLKIYYFSNISFEHLKFPTILVMGLIVDNFYQFATIMWMRFLPFGTCIPFS